VHALFFQEAAPGDVRCLVETGRYLDQDGHLLATPRCFDQRVHDRRVAARAVDREFECQHGRIRGGGIQEAQHGRVEAVVRMVQQDVAPRDLVEHGPRIVRRQVDQPGVDHRFVTGQPEVVALGRFKRLQVAQAHDGLRGIDVVGAQTELLDQPPGELLRRGGLDLQAYRTGKAARLELGADLLDDAAGLAERNVGEIGRVVRIGAPGDLEKVHGARGRPRVQQVEVGRDHLLQAHDTRTFQQRDPARPVARNLDADEALATLVAVAKKHGEVQSQVADERKRMLRIDGERSQDGLHVALEVVAKVTLLLLVQLGVRYDG
jgi:hypothetical protein